MCRLFSLHQFSVYIFPSSDIVKKAAAAPFHHHHQHHTSEYTTHAMQTAKQVQAIDVEGSAVVADKADV